MKVLEIPNFSLDALCQLNTRRYPFLLESVNHNINNRYSILFAHPQQELVLENLTDFNFLETLSSQITTNNTQYSQLPFTGGWFVYLSYELIGQIEPTLLESMYSSNLPVAIASKIPCAIVLDHQLNKTYLLDEQGDQTRIDQVLTDIKQVKVDADSSNFSGVLDCEPDAKFLSGVEKEIVLFLQLASTIFISGSSSYRKSIVLNPCVIMSLGRTI